MLCYLYSLPRPPSLELRRGPPESPRDVDDWGEGSSFAMAAARSMVAHSELSAREIVEESIRIASSICIYTNENIVVEELKTAGD